MKNFPHITRNISIINYLFSVLQLLSNTIVISYYFSLPQPFVWAYWNFLAFSQSSFIGSFCFAFWGFCYCFMHKQSMGTSGTEPLDATLTPDGPRVERKSSPLADLANSLEGGWCLCESGGCARVGRCPTACSTALDCAALTPHSQSRGQSFPRLECMVMSLFLFVRNVAEFAGNKNERSQNFEVCSVYIDKHCVAVSQEAAHPRLGCVVFPVFVCALIHNKQQN